MRVLAVLFLLLSIAFSQESREVYFPVNVKLVPPPDQTSTTLFEAKFNLGHNLGSCGDLSDVLGLKYLTNNFDQMWNNLQSMALPASLYFVATYMPVVSEVFTAVQWLQNVTAQLAGTNCEQVFNAIRTMNADRSKLVQMCVEKRVEEGMSTDDAYDYCLKNGLSLGDLVGLVDQDLGKKLSLKGMYRCMLAKSLGKDPKDCIEPNNNCSFLERTATLSYLMLSDIDLSASGSIKLQTEDSDLAFQLGKFKQMVERDLMEDYQNYKEKLETCKNYLPSNPSQFESCVQNATDEFLRKYYVEWEDFPYLVSFIQDLKEAIKERQTKTSDEALKVEYLVLGKKVEMAEEKILKALLDKISLVALEKALDQLRRAYYTLLAYEKSGGTPKCEF